MEPDPTPVRCPVITNPEAGLADPEDFTGLLARLEDPTGVERPEQFARGVLQPDGRLDLCKQGVGPVMAARLVRAAAQSNHTRHVLLGTNGLGREGAQAIAEALPADHRFETLYLGCNRIDADGLAPLAQRLETDRRVRALWLKRNPIGDAGVDRLCQALERNDTLRTLDLVNVGLSVRGLRVLAETLARRAVRMERLFLGGNGLVASAAPVLASLMHDAGIRELYLSANHLGDDGVAELARAGTALPMTFGLGGNGITPVGVAAIADAMAAWHRLDLARPPSTGALRAVSNVVGDAGAAALARTLPGSALRRLDLRRTGLTGRGARVLLAAAQEHPTLQYLGLGSGTPRRMRRRASELLADGRTVTPPHPDIQAITSVYR